MTHPTEGVRTAIEGLIRHITVGLEILQQYVMGFEKLERVHLYRGRAEKMFFHWHEEMKEVRHVVVYQGDY